MAKATAIEDMRNVDPVAYIRATGLRPEDSYGFLPEVEKDRWPREKVVMRKQGSDLGDALRKKIGVWGYEPEDSFGFCPDFDNSAIYFAFRR
jgi:hypothetical protein